MDIYRIRRRYTVKYINLDIGICTKGKNRYTEGKMIVKEITIRNPQGLQSKCAAIFIQKATGYKANIWISKGERKANGKSLLGVLSLAIGKDSVISLSAEGEDEAEAVSELESYLLADAGETV